MGILIATIAMQKWLAHLVPFPHQYANTDLVPEARKEHGLPHLGRPTTRTGGYLKMYITIHDVCTQVHRNTTK